MKKKRLIAIVFALVALLSLSTGCFNDSNPSDQVTQNTEVIATAPTPTTETATERTTETNQALLEANIKNWKLGNELIFYAGSNRSYDWYLDQAHTGEHSISNCGPTSVAMAAKWADEAFDGTAEEARDDFRPEGGWWYGEDIEGSLKKFKIDYDTVMIEDAYTLKSIIDSGKIAIINNSMGYITRETDTEAHTNRFYDFDSGHYLILKGYAQVDQTTYFEFYDPNNWDMTYVDGTPMGKDRYYESSVLMDSINNWYPYAIVINPSN
jgi:hypothetical protein